MGKPVNVVQDGKTFQIDEAQLPAALEQGFRLEGVDEHAQRLGSEFKADVYGGAAGKVLAGAAAIGRGATLGGSDALIAAGGGGEALRNLEEQNPTISTVGNIVGAVGPAIVTAGASTPTALASRAGRAIAGTGERSVARAVAGGAVEGAIQGAGQSVSELATSADPLTAERIASSLTSNVLMGGALGGAVGGVTRAAEKGLTRAKVALDEHVANSARVQAIGEDLAGLDAKGLRAAKDAETATLETARVAERKTIADELATFRSETKGQKLWLATKGADEAEIRVIGKQTLKADRQLDGLLDNPKALAERPEAAKFALQKQEHALEQLLKKEPEIRAAAAADSAKIPRSAGEIAEEAEGKVVEIRARDLEKRGYYESPGRGADAVKMDKARTAIAEGQTNAATGVVDADGRIHIDDGRHRLAAAIEADAPIKIRFYKSEPGVRFGQAGTDVEVLSGAGNGLPGAGATSARVAALDQVPAALERNRALQKRIADIVAPHASPKLAAIADATDALASGGGKTAAGSLMQGVVAGPVFGGVAGMVGSIPVLGQIPGVAHRAGAGAAKLVTDLMFGKLGASTAAIASRTSKAVGAFANVLEKAAPVAPVLASKILASVRYAPEDDKARRARERGDVQPEAKLAASFRARADELRGQVAYDQTGTARMRPEARMAMAARMSPITAHDPVLADRVETVVARKVEYLASKLPKRPDLGVMQIGPDRWQPSDMEMRTFARHAAAVEDPGGVEERLAHGSITPEDAEAYKAVYPERFADMMGQIIGSLAELRATLPYQRRLALSIFSGVPVDAAMTPQILAVLQGSYVSEEGTEGGTQAPKAMPQFGSVTKPTGTPSQERQS